MKEGTPLKLRRRDIFDLSLLVVSLLAIPVSTTIFAVNKAILNSTRRDFNSDENGRPYGQSYSVPPDITGLDRVLVTALGLADSPVLRAEFIIHSRQEKKIATPSK